jgi:prepilin-type processing-associated H-X9-DG protein
MATKRITMAGSMLSASEARLLRALRTRFTATSACLRNIPAWLRTAMQSAPGQRHLMAMSRDDAGEDITPTAQFNGLRVIDNALPVEMQAALLEWCQSGATLEKWRSVNDKGYEPLAQLSIQFDPAGHRFRPHDLCGDDIILPAPVRDPLVALCTLLYNSAQRHRPDYRANAMDIYILLRRDRARHDDGNVSQFFGFGHGIRDGMHEPHFDGNVQIIYTLEQSAHLSTALNYGPASRGPGASMARFTGELTVTPSVPNRAVLLTDRIGDQEMAHQLANYAFADGHTSGERYVLTVSMFYPENSQL